MKNVRGEDVGFDDHDGKKKYYNETKPVKLEIQHIGPREAMSILPGKDDVFLDILIPFCQLNELKTVLDCGAAQGRYSAWFDDFGFSVTGVEISSDCVGLLRMCLDHNSLRHVPVMEMDMETVSEQGLGEWDLIFMSDIVEHFIDWRTTMEKIAKHCKYCYMLIPGERSWDWSPDHLHIFDDEKVAELTGIFKKVIFCQKVMYNDELWWYAILCKGYLE